MKEIVEYNTWIQGSINMNILKNEWDQCILLWKNGQDKLSEERSCKNSTHGMIFVVRNYMFKYAQDERTWNTNDFLLWKGWKNESGILFTFLKTMIYKEHIFIKKNEALKVMLERKWGEQHEISSGYQSYCNLHIVPNPVFFVTYFSVTS